MRIFTIGFTKQSAESFFEALRASGAARLVDVRLNNVSQLAGFAKREDLRYFARSICGIDYVHRLDLAPTQAMLDAHRRRRGGWDAYKREFIALMKSRRIEATVPRELMDGACLLCSEHEPDRCHRRLVAEYLQQEWGHVTIDHIV